MKKIRDYILEAEAEKKAIGHFNISDLTSLKGIFEAARELGVPVIIGVSEGERNFIGAKQAVLLVKNLREEYDYPIFLNADHTKSFEKIKEAVDAGFDMVMFDGSNLPVRENIEETKKAVQYAKKFNPDILVEGELGKLMGGSSLLTELPEGFSSGDETDPGEAEKFVRETGIDLFAPAVGNIHGVVLEKDGTNAHYFKPKIDIQRIKDIKEAVQAAMVLHGGSGTSDEQFLSAIDAGISVIHINTELRIAWRQSLEKVLGENPQEIVPYKLLSPVVGAVKEVAGHKLKLFNKQL